MRILEQIIQMCLHPKTSMIILMKALQILTKTPTELNISHHSTTALVANLYHLSLTVYLMRTLTVNIEKPEIMWKSLLQSIPKPHTLSLPLRKRKRRLALSTLRRKLGHWWTRVHWDSNAGSG